MWLYTWITWESFSFFWTCHVACGILVSRPGIEPTFPALEGWSLNHWTTREVPKLFCLCGFHQFCWRCRPIRKLFLKISLSNSFINPADEYQKLVRYFLYLTVNFLHRDHNDEQITCYFLVLAQKLSSLKSKGWGLHILLPYGPLIPQNGAEDMLWRSMNESSLQSCCLSYTGWGRATRFISELLASVFKCDGSGSSLVA